MRVLDWSRFMEGALLAGSLKGGTAMTVGVFDGVHRGHQALIGRILRQAPGCIPTVITFRQNPKKELHPGEYRGDIVGLDRKMIIFEALGVELVILIDFSGDFSKLNGRDFFGFLKSRGRLNFLAVGRNFRCGSGLDTGVREIKKLNPETEVVPPVMEGGLPVSSSRIREAVSSGGLDKAAALLGRKVEIDLAGLSPRPRPGGLFYEARSHYRILPPPGRYAVIFYESPQGGGMETEVLIEDDGVFIPSLNQADRIEFIKGPV
ncbi:MAG: FAD synthetase family protein [Spirochaetaceae bacterium]|jgi:riboflavin kinase/FMN adenylyltransferase|nr:FAD synthetase family protein [Spirochaetaceae bacterium]